MGTPRRKTGPRAPLGDVSPRVNSAPAESFPHPPRTRTYQNEKENVPIRATGSAVSKHVGASESVPSITKGRHGAAEGAPPAVVEAKRQSQVSTDSKRTSQVSAYSAPPIKTHIGPWQLGRTLGKGSSARVRLARHRITRQSVAVKIVPKQLAHITQAGSLAHLDQIDQGLPETVDGVRRLPLAIEREIAILKLIEHPNIIKLYDMWENRNEIYLILEYVEGGDLFEFINTHGPMTEHDAVYVFRQMLCAMEYCHAYNICHRDLKPENILLNPDGTVKICDFGMSALHQAPNEKLLTSCGSPHYAAPEVLRNRPYKGDKSDIWSMGVILFAMLAARLPFDEPDLRAMIAKAKRGLYMMPKTFSRDARDLIDRILQVNPADRISMAEIWEHPLVSKYNNVPGFERQRDQPTHIRAADRARALDPRDIDPQILRQLRAMWHTFGEDLLAQKLATQGANDQKLFYHLLVSHRDRQLENYDPQLTHSASDYHHLRPPAWTTRVTTRQFKSQGRTPSRFTVISTVAETEGGTVRSYDPFYASRVMQPGQASHAKITVHRNGSEHGTEASTYSNPQISRVAGGPRKRPGSQRSRTAHPYQSPVSSLSSIQSSRQGTPSIRAKPRYKRGVDFSNVRNRPAQPARQDRGGDQEMAPGVAYEDAAVEIPIPPRSPARKRPTAKEATATAAPAPKARVADARRTADDTHLWTEDLIQFSESIAKDCDDAFGSSLISTPSIEAGAGSREATPFSLNFDIPAVQKASAPSYPPPASTHPWDTRPLPPLPPKLEPTHRQVANVKASSSGQRHSCGDRAPGSSSRGTAPLRTSQSVDRRVVSAPAYDPHGRNNRHMPSIHEDGAQVASQARIVSAPQPRTTPSSREKKALEYLAAAENTIRVVYSPSQRPPAAGPVVPEPLNVRKKLPRDISDVSHPSEVPSGLELRREQAPSSRAWGVSAGAGNRSSSHSSENGLRKKKSSWFRRTSKEDMHDESMASAMARPSGPAQPARMQSTSTDAPPVLPAPKKRSFAFWKSAKAGPRMSIGGPEYRDPPSPQPKKAVAKQSSRANSGNWQDDSYASERSGRKIETHQNWIARLFRVKPAMRYTCLAISKRRARQEAAILLRQWRKYGIRDIEVDKERDVIFARVGRRNHLELKEVSFAIEIMTVIEHGKRNHLSIMRFTQEKGAASSFNKVVDTMEKVFAGRSLLVGDKRKRKMMVRTLNS